MASATFCNFETIIAVIKVVIETWFFFFGQIHIDIHSEDAGERSDRARIKVDSFYSIIIRIIILLVLRSEIWRLISRALKCDFDTLILEEKSPTDPPSHALPPLGRFAPSHGTPDHPPNRENKYTHTHTHTHTHTLFHSVPPNELTHGTPLIILILITVNYKCQQ